MGRKDSFSLVFFFSVSLYYFFNTLLKVSSLTERMSVLVLPSHPETWIGEFEHRRPGYVLAM